MRERHVMPSILVSLAGLVALALLSATPALAQQTPVPGQTNVPGQMPALSAGAPDLNALLEQFEAGAAEAPGSVRLDAWVETGDGGQELVVLVAPEGEAKLVADPGITVTPAGRQGVEWLVPLPHRLIDPKSEYLDPPAMARLPFIADDDQPLRLLVEYAYCFVNYQCFFGEQELTVATAP